MAGYGGTGWAAEYGRRNLCLALGARASAALAPHLYKGDLALDAPGAVRRHAPALRAWAVAALAGWAAAPLPQPPVARWEHELLRDARALFYHRGDGLYVYDYPGALRGGAPDRTLRNRGGVVVWRLDPRRRDEIEGADAADVLDEVAHGDSTDGAETSDEEAALEAAAGGGGADDAASGGGSAGSFDYEEALGLGPPRAKWAGTWARAPRRLRAALVRAQAAAVDGRPRERVKWRDVLAAARGDGDVGCDAALLAALRESGYVRRAAEAAPRRG